jgi:hypothetical protein
LRAFASAGHPAIRRSACRVASLTRLSQFAPDTTAKFLIGLAAIGGGQLHADHLHGLELGQHLAGCGATGQRPQLGLRGDLQAACQEGHEDVGLDARLGLVEDRPDGQVVLDLLEGLLDLGELDVERPQRIGLVRREVGSQQVAAFSSAHLAQFLAIQAEWRFLAGECRRTLLLRPRAHSAP